MAGKELAAFTTSGARKSWDPFLSVVDNSVTNSPVSNTAEEQRKLPRSQSNSVLVYGARSPTFFDRSKNAVPNSPEQSSSHHHPSFSSTEDDMMMQHRIRAVTTDALPRSTKSYYEAASSPKSPVSTRSLIHTISATSTSPNSNNFPSMNDHNIVSPLNLYGRSQQQQPDNNSNSNNSSRIVHSSSLSPSSSSGGAAGSLNTSNQLISSTSLPSIHEEEDQHNLTTLGGLMSDTHQQDLIKGILEDFDRDDDRKGKTLKRSVTFSGVVPENLSGGSPRFGLEHYHSFGGLDSQAEVSTALSSPPSYRAQFKLQQQQQQSGPLSLRRAMSDDAHGFAAATAGMNQQQHRLAPASTTTAAASYLTAASSSSGNSHHQLGGGGDIPRSHSSSSIGNVSTASAAIPISRHSSRTSNSSPTSPSKTIQSPIYSIGSANSLDDYSLIPNSTSSTAAAPNGPGIIGDGFSINSTSHQQNSFPNDGGGGGRSIAYMNNNQGGGGLPNDAYFNNLSLGGGGRNVAPAFPFVQMMGPENSDELQQYQQHQMMMQHQQQYHDEQQGDHYIPQQQHMMLQQEQPQHYNMAYNNNMAGNSYLGAVMEGGQNNNAAVGHQHHLHLHHAGIGQGGMMMQQPVQGMQYSSSGGNTSMQGVKKMGILQPNLMMMQNNNVMMPPQQQPQFMDARGNPQQLAHYQMLQMEALQRQQQQLLQQQQMQAWEMLTQQQQQQTNMLRASMNNPNNNNGGNNNNNAASYVNAATAHSSNPGIASSSAGVVGGAVSSTAVAATASVVLEGGGDSSLASVHSNKAVQIPSGNNNQQHHHGSGGKQTQYQQSYARNSTSHGGAQQQSQSQHNQNIGDRARDPKGSRQLQRDMEKAERSKNRSEMRTLIEELKPYMVSLAFDPFGNYCVQCYLTCSHGGEEGEMIAGEFRHRLRELAGDQHGCRVLQKILEVLGAGHREPWVLEELLLVHDSSPKNKASSPMAFRKQYKLDGDWIRLASQDNCATFVLQKAVDIIWISTSATGGNMENLAIPPRLGFHLIEQIGTELLPLIESLATDKLGTKVVQGLLGKHQHLQVENTTSGNKQGGGQTPESAGTMQMRHKVVEIILKSLDVLSTDQHGNFVLQHLIMNGLKSERDIVMRHVTKGAVSLSRHKFASHLVEKAVACGLVRELCPLVQELLPGWKGLVADPFGNYVAKRIIERVDQVGLGNPKAEAEFWSQN